MERILKVFCSGSEQDRLAEEIPVLERYSGFLLTRLVEQDARDLAHRYPVEDITDQYQISVGERTIDTDLPRVEAGGRTRTHPDYKGERRLMAGAHHYLVQFLGPIKQEWLAGVEAAGGRLRDPRSAFSYVVQADEDVIARIAALPFVRWTGHLSHGDRIASSALRGADRKQDEVGSELPRTRVLPGLYSVSFFDAETLEEARESVSALGFEILDADPEARRMILEAPDAKGRAKAIRALSAVHGVRMIREQSLKRTSNDLAPRLMAASRTTTDNGLGLDGEGETIGVCDTGIDTGDPATVHQDFRGRMAWVKSYPIRDYYRPYINNPGGDDGAADLDSGHGTHVAGSVLGDGSESLDLSGLEGPIRGLAHKARLVFQAVEQEMKWKNASYYQEIGRFLLAGIPEDLGGLFGDAYAHGVRVHSNSWGGGDPGEYDEQCEQLDRFVWEHKDFCVLVAAGNDGTDRDGDGHINPMSVTSPATAKNCICIGACENDRPRFNAERYGDWWSSDYPVAPYHADPMADNPDQVVAFSSRGPTKDGRIRPDLLAPGTFVLSTRSTMIAPNNNAWAALASSRKYFHMGGTSMATPLAAGAAALVRQYLRRDQGISSPSAALIKAVLVAGARRLPSTESAGAQWDNEQGFGRLDLDTSLAPALPARAQYLDLTEGLATGELWSRELDIAGSDAALRVVMVYSDYPGERLVNNLNLIVVGPDGRRHVGNGGGDGELTMDSANTVEVVHLPVPQAGTWRIDVVASNVPQPAQPFALVVIGPLGTNEGEGAAAVPIRVEHTLDLAIPDNDRTGVSDAIIITHPGNLIGAVVTVDIRHTYIGDLKLELVAPDGTGVVLHNREGASADDIHKRYDVHNTPALAGLAGKPIAGEWRLTIADLARRDLGTLISWSLEIVPEASGWEELESAPGTSIPDNDRRGISDSLETARSGVVKELEVSVDITHTWIGDLRVTLTGPSGTTAVLHERSGGSEDNLIRRYDTAGAPGLAAFIGESGQGTWTLNVSDNAGRDLGKLNAWGLRVRF
jgi:subtilisin-like proprotein convertase family protein/subtilisin family serine protease